MPAKPMPHDEEVTVEVEIEDEHEEIVDLDTDVDFRDDPPHATDPDDTVGGEG